jgi:hypothetical protein
MMQMFELQSSTMLFDDAESTGPESNDLCSDDTNWEDSHDSGFNST